METLRIFYLIWLALILTWNPVTTDSSGMPLDPSLAVLEYSVYRCPSANVCTVADGTKIATVAAPGVTLDITVQPRPSSYVVTATNIVEESGASNSLKVTGPHAPTIFLK